MNRAAGPIAVVELVGLPGAGKTTVARALAALETVVVRSRYRAWSTVPAYAHTAIRLAPAMASSLGGSSWRERRRLLRLASSEGVLLRARRDPGVATVVFDQGPVYLLRQLAAPRDPVAALRAVYLERWASLMDLILVLDASDEVLLGRTRTREKDHRLKDAPIEDARRGLAEERRSQTRVLDELVEVGAVPVRHIDTTDSRIEETVRAVERSLRETGSRAERRY